MLLCLRLGRLSGEPRDGGALRQTGAAAALREAIGTPLSATERAKLDRLLAPTRQALEPEAQSALEAEGGAWPLERAIEYALSDQP